MVEQRILDTSYHAYPVHVGFSSTVEILDMEIPL